MTACTCLDPLPAAYGLTAVLVARYHRTECPMAPEPTPMPDDPAFHVDRERMTPAQLEALILLGLDKETTR